MIFYDAMYRSHIHSGWTPFYFMYDPKCSTTFPWCTINAPAAFAWCTINVPAAFAWCTNRFVHKVEFSYIGWNGVHPQWYWLQSFIGVYYVAQFIDLKSLLFLTLINWPIDKQLEGHVCDYIRLHQRKIDRFSSKIGWNMTSIQRWCIWYLIYK